MSYQIEENYTKRMKSLHGKDWQSKVGSKSPMTRGASKAAEKSEFSMKRDELMRDLKKLQEDLGATLTEPEPRNTAPMRNAMLSVAGSTKHTLKTLGKRSKQ